MEIVQVVGVGIAVTFLVMVLKEQKPLFAFLLATFAGIVIFVTTIGNIANIFQALQDIAKQGEDRESLLCNDDQNSRDCLYCERHPLHHHQGQGQQDPTPLPTATTWTASCSSSIPIAPISS